MQCITTVFPATRKAELINALLRRSKIYVRENRDFSKKRSQNSYFYPTAFLGSRNGVFSDYLTLFLSWWLKAEKTRKEHFLRQRRSKNYTYTVPRRIYEERWPQTIFKNFTKKFALFRNFSLFFLISFWCCFDPGRRATPCLKCLFTIFLVLRCMVAESRFWCPKGPSSKRLFHYFTLLLFVTAKSQLIFVHIKVGILWRRM